MALFHSPRIITDGLRSCVDAGNTKSYPGTGTTWSDLSGYSNNYVNTNVSYNAAGYFTYNGTTSYSQMNPSTPNSFTADNGSSSVGVWFRPHTVTPAGNMAIFTDDFGPEYGIWLLTNGFTTGYAYGGVNAGVAEVANQWTYSVITVTAAAASSGGGYTLKTYKDGINSNQISGTVGNGLNDWPITLGRDWQSGSPTAYFDGDIAIVQIYQKILSDDEVYQNFLAHRKRFGL